MARLDLKHGEYVLVEYKCKTPMCWCQFALWLHVDTVHPSMKCPSCGEFAERMKED